jgi:hypothetical protein
MLVPRPPPRSDGCFPALGRAAGGMSGMSAGTPATFHGCDARNCAIPGAAAAGSRRLQAHRPVEEQSWLPDVPAGGAGRVEDDQRIFATSVLIMPAFRQACSA